MYDQIQEYSIFVMLYAVVMTMALMASAYLLFRRGNAFAEDIIPPLRLRRWTAAFFGIMAAGHLWYLPGEMVDDSQAATLWMLIGGLLDCLLTLPVALIVMLCMLQDRRRPLWPVWLAMVPLVIMMGVNIANRNDALLPWMQGYFLLAVIGFTVYMVREVQRYGRWLRDNYADLEHKEVWKSLLVIAAIILLFVYYVVGYGGMTYEFIVQVCGIAMICYLLWRVETLQDLNLPISSENIVVADATPIDDSDAMDTMIATEETEEADASLSVRNNIGPLLRQHCEEPQLYLQYDLSLTQLATLIGVNRSYLSKHFALQGITYNTYINDLRIRHFVSLCQERAAAHQPLSVQQLSLDSGFRSYSTFNGAFKQVMHTTATEWLRLLAE
ncbi:MAG: helix-turn-helix domain-containing protein [Bacteroidaceae bacterium]|nr:helix-turn-helix domain-containing protein [Bacteroidaceae bacterium]